MVIGSVEKVEKQGYLLFDEHAVKNSLNCTLRFSQTVKDPSNPVLSSLKPWDGDGPYTASGRIIYLPEQGVYRMPYATYSSDPYGYGSGYAESTDGLHWDRPALKGKKDEDYEHHFDESLGRRGFYSLPRNPCMTIYDPRPDCPEDERFKSMSFRMTGNIVSFSPDGISNFKEYSGNPVWNTTSDSMYHFWDPNLQKFVCYYKLWKLSGQEKDDSQEGSHPMEALCVTWDTKELSNGWVELSGDYFVTLHPDKKAELSYKKYIVRSNNQGEDDGGGGCLSGAWSSKRVICRAVSTDFIHWEEEQLVLDVDELDRPDSNIQYAQVFHMGGYYLAMLSMHDNRGFFDQQLAFSADGIHWKRPWRGNLIAHGSPGQFDHGEISPPMPPIITETQMVFYYGGLEREHKYVHDRGNIAIGRAILRRDGFACWQADDEVATLQSVLFTVKQDGLYINANAEGGWITAALLDETGSVIPGFEHDKCSKIIEDSVSYSDCFIPVHWEGMPALPNGKVSVQLRFANASIYSILL